MIEAFVVEAPFPGKLAIVQRPRGGHWLDDDLRDLRASGFDTVVSALMPREQREAWLDDEAEACERAGLAFLAFPIGNMLVPAPDVAARHLWPLAGNLLAGRGVAVHCYASVGRASLIAASLLLMTGELPGSAWERVALARGRAVPDTDEQRAWLYTFARQLEPSPLLPETDLPLR